MFLTSTPTNLFKNDLMNPGHINELDPLSPLKVLIVNQLLFKLVSAPCMIASTEFRPALCKSPTVPFFISPVTDKVNPRFVANPVVYSEIAVLAYKSGCSSARYLEIAAAPHVPLFPC